MRPMSKLHRNAPCHCGSGKKYKNCHLDTDEKLARQERASAAAVAAADEMPPVDENGQLLPPPMDPDMPSKPLGASFWVLAPIGLAVVLAMGYSQGVGAAITVALAWALGMVAYGVLRDPPPPKPRTEIPPGMNFGRTPEERQSGTIRTQPARNRTRTRR